MKFKDSVLHGPHSQLASLAGNWEGEIEVWFDADASPERGQLVGTIQTMLDKRFIRFDYSNSMQGETHSGMLLIGYYLVRKACTISWIDSFHTGTQILQLESTELGKEVFEGKGSYSDPSGGPDWFWRIVIEPLPENKLAIRHYNIHPNAQEDTAIRILLERK